MQYSEDTEVIKTWMPLVMENRDPKEPIAATYMPIGTDIDFGALTRAMVNHLTKTEYVSLHLNHEVKNLLQDDK